MCYYGVLGQIVIGLIIAKFKIAMLQSSVRSGWIRFAVVSWACTMHVLANASEVSGWVLNLETGNGKISVPLVLDDANGKSYVVNGPERIEVDVDKTADHIRVSFPHYASEILCKKQGDSFKGVWTKLRGAGKEAEVECEITRPVTVSFEDPKQFLGRWKVQFEDSDDPAVAVFELFNENEVTGTFLTTTGDYRYLRGFVTDGELQLCCFDGAHAFLFNASVSEAGGIRGTFSSGNWYETSWTASRDPSARLPDAFKQTVEAEGKIRELSFPDLKGVRRSLSEEGLYGRVTLIELFGSWCPNCHDEANYLRELRSKYGDKGLKVVGLAFELTGQLESDAEQVRKYVERFDVDYPVLIAGISDKKEASKSFPVLDRIRSYPTTLFVDSTGEIRAIYTGFSGPATGEAHVRLRERFERLITQLLSE